MKLSMNVMKNFGAFTLSTDIAVSGDRFGIFGVSGSGKSTLVSMLAGLLKPDSGEIFLNGNCLFSKTKRINLRPEQRRIAMVFQQHCLFPHLSVKNNLLYGFKRCHPERRSIDFNALVEALKLEKLLEREVNNLSGGEKQRVAIGRAILSNPRLLIMDEPLSALDDDLKFQIIPFLRKVFEEFSVPFLFISHSLVEMRLMAEEVIVLEKGRLMSQTCVEELARRRMGASQTGYINLLRLGKPRRSDGLFAYPWGGVELLISAGREEDGAIFELSSKDIILFKKHPEAISARNLLHGRVVTTFAAGNKTGVEIDCGGERLVAEVVNEAARELDIRKGGEVFAAIKASAFRRLC